ncbi:hypothetical protein L211DRAFT_851723 [Terfezia boudieri ATCC MYA-4762]|uniref:Uncharacterized protein n=1 Tax=Terfezia boudieri ATCC MYA-4762 TaxID=1051890 RepID=A0A3N4LSZ9_9PEZI|nr:hypothetical protein L211DRAFT_851723 [Terfezia boudieri ATCC MYA-4762]
MIKPLFALSSLSPASLLSSIVQQMEKQNDVYGAIHYILVQNMIYQRRRFTEISYAEIHMKGWNWSGDPTQGHFKLSATRAVCGGPLYSNRIRALSTSPNVNASIGALYPRSASTKWSMKNQETSARAASLGKKSITKTCSFSGRGTTSGGSNAFRTTP